MLALQKVEVVEILGKPEIFTTWQEGMKGTTACWYTMDGNRLAIFPGDDVFPVTLPGDVLQECKNAYNQSTQSQRES